MASQTELIHGKIAKILSQREIALNVGKAHGVEIGMLFDILSSDGLAIKDPDTGEFLGSLEAQKARVRIARVYDKFSVAATYRTKRVNANRRPTPSDDLNTKLNALFEPPRWVDRHETLKIKGSDEHAGGDSSEPGNYVSTGDVVVQVIADDQ